ncbi:unnamed protein product [Staurois parvus]|uniref:Uncharacterized protein n=1 Tax=Staurois parvus TaxID=386267 RepID=A0ABN9AD81_9NEOB|nr:unnamed protein product [Staurois parvus]
MESLLGHRFGKLIHEDEFLSLLRGKRKAAWTAFVSVTSNFLGNNKTPDYKKVVEKTLPDLQKSGLQHVSKNSFSTFASGFFPTKLWSSE